MFPSAIRQVHSRGVGSAKRLNLLKFKVIEKTLWEWVLTIPAAGGVAFGLVWLGNKMGFIKF